MKEDINTILSYYRECSEKTGCLRDWILSLIRSQPEELQLAVDQLHDAIKQIKTEDYQQAGAFYLFLGCLYYEQNEFQKAAHCLQNTIKEIWDTHIHKSLAHWLLGLIYSNMQEFPKARQELENALQLLATNTNVNSLRINTEDRKRQNIRQEIRNALDQLAIEPLFRNIPPAPAQSADPYPTQNPSVGRNAAEREKSQANPATSSSSKTQEKENGVPFVEETRTDGYVLFQSLPVYEQNVAASKTGKPEIGLNEVGFAEAKIIVLNNQPHKLYPLKSTSNEIKIAANGKNMGWVKICGHSMNKIRNKTSIPDGDFVLLLFSSDADDNDIVLASFEDPQTTQSFLTVKRYRKEELILRSESSEKGPEFEDINLGDLCNAKIIGIAYAVAKPI